MQLAPSGTDRAEAEALAALLASDRLARATYAATGVDDPRLVFADANGNEVHPHALSQAFDRIVRRAPCRSSAFTSSATRERLSAGANERVSLASLIEANRTRRLG